MHENNPITALTYTKLTITQWHYMRLYTPNVTHTD